MKSFKLLKTQKKNCTFESSSAVTRRCFLLPQKYHPLRKLHITKSHHQHKHSSEMGFEIRPVFQYSTCTLYRHPKENAFFSHPYTRHRTPKTDDHYPWTVNYI